MLPPMSFKSFPWDLPGHAGTAAPAQRLQLRRGDPGALRQRRRPRGLAAAPRDAPGAAAHHGGHAAAVPQTGHLPGSVARWAAKPLEAVTKPTSLGGQQLFWGVWMMVCVFFLFGDFIGDEYIYIYIHTMFGLFWYLLCFYFLLIFMVVLVYWCWEIGGNTQVWSYWIGILDIFRFRYPTFRCLVRFMCWT